MQRAITWLMLVGMACATGCGEPARVRVVDQVEPGGTFSTQDVVLATIIDLAAVEGEAAHFLGDAKIDLLAAEANLLAGRNDQTVISEAQTIEARWILDGAVAVASDYDTLAMFTAYWHVERAHLFFESAGVVADALTGLAVYYRPRLVGETGPIGSTDNAMYFSPADAMVLLPQQLLQDIPLAMNSGVIGHELGHRVSSYELWSGRYLETVSQMVGDPTLSNQFNLLRALDEGIADFMGASIIGDPGFLAHSLPTAFTVAAKERDLAVPRAMQASWADGSQPTIIISPGYEEYDPYKLGSVLASALWRLAESNNIDRQQLAATIVLAQRDIAPQLIGNFNYAVGDFELALLTHLDAATHDTACTLFVAAYPPVADRFTAVCP